MTKKNTNILKAALVLLVMLFTCYIPAIVNAQDYGNGSIGMQLEFKNQAEDKFTVDSITINNEFPWTSAQDTYMVDERKLIVTLEVTPKGEYIPRISYCGDDCGKAFNVVKEESGSKYIFTVTITEPEQDFTTFDLVEDEPINNNPDNPDEPRTCTVSFVMNGGEEIPDAEFVCGNPAPPPSSDQIKNGDRIFAGWYENEELTDEYHFDVDEDRHVFVYAKWEDPKENPETTDNGEEPRYHVVLDFNGAKDKEGHTRIETDSVGYVPFIVTENFIDEVGVIPPEGQTLVAIKINGKIYEIDKDLGYELNKDTTFVYIWSGSEKNNEVEITTSSGFTVSFEGEEDEEYGLTVVDVLTLSNDQISELGVTEEQFKQIKDQIIEATKDYGDLLNVFVIEVDHRGQQYTGSVEIKVKMTESMKKYNKFKFVYVDEDNNFKVGDLVDVRIEGDYLIGTLPHLSVYAVTGEYIEEEQTNTNNPNTGDNIISSIIMLSVSILGLSSGIIYYKKKYSNN